MEAGVYTLVLTSLRVVLVVVVVVVGEVVLLAVYFGTFRDRPVVVELFLINFEFR